MAEIRQLRNFLAVAERGSVSAAALDLHLSQSALSEAMRKLEVELGAELLERASRGVALTAAGEVMAREAREAVARFDAALDAVRGAALGQTGRLRVGFEAAGAGRLCTRSRARFLARFPHVRVEPRRYDWGGEVAALRDGECDVAFVWLPADLTGLRSEMRRRPSRASPGSRWSTGSPRASRCRSNELDRRADHVDPASTALLGGLVGGEPAPDGREPTWGPENDNVEEMLEQVADGSANCIVPGSMTEYYARPDLVWVPMDDVEPLRIALAWRERDGSPLVAAYAAIVRELA